jgi:transposase
VPVDLLGYRGACVPDEIGDRLDGHAVVTHDGYEGVTEFPGSPVLPDVGLPGPAESAPDVAGVEGTAGPDTVIRWHRDLVRRRRTAPSKPKRRGRPPTVRSIRVLVLRLVRENPGWGYRHVHGELLVLGVKVAASTVWEILQDAGIDPAPERAAGTWAAFLRSQADALLPATSWRPSS